jgi:hypothetical protein
MGIRVSRRRIGRLKCELGLERVSRRKRPDLSIGYESPADYEGFMNSSPGPSGPRIPTDQPQSARWPGSNPYKRRAEICPNKLRWLHLRFSELLCRACGTPPTRSHPAQIRRARR